MAMRTILCAAVSCGFLSVAASAATPSVPFPFAPLRSGELVLDRPTAARIACEDALVVTGIALPGAAAPLDVVLTRVDPAIGAAEVHVDGSIASWSPADGSSTWTGHVANEPDSEVFLGLSPLGSRGWIRSERGTWHLLAARGAQPDWSESVSRFVSEDELEAQGFALTWTCPVGPHGFGAQPRVELPATPPTGAWEAGAAGDVLSCKLAIETDYQLFQKFSNVTAEQNYLTQLFAAASARYDADLTTQLQIVYLGLHTSANDGWVSGDNGAGSGAMLDEFRTAWAGHVPNGANLAHFISGASLGGGVAYLSVLCNPDWGFAVSGDFAGNTPFPVTQGPLTWDFMVFTHEMGHQFAAPHTHDMCPPIDTCAPQGYFGQCQTSQSCISDGTIMSYCHLCSGGMSNIALHFHPASIGIMRPAAQSSCLVPLCVAPYTYCATSPNSFDIFGAYMSFDGSNRLSRNDLVLTTSGVPPNAAAMYYYGRNPAFAAFGNGTRCVASPAYRLPVLHANPWGEVALPIDYTALPAAGQISAGQTWNFQLWYRNPLGGGAGFNLSDALRIQFCP